MRWELLILSVLASVAPWTARASQTVLFEDGRTLEVDGAEFHGEEAELTLDGGARISLPAARIANRGALRPAPPAPPPAEPAPAEPDEPWRQVAGEYAQVIADAAKRHELSPELLAAVALAESNFDPRAVSHKGACGLLQLLPATAVRFGVRDIFDATQNVEGGARYLRWLLKRYEGKTELAVAGYNAGEAAVDRYGGVPPYPETRRYVERVMLGANRLARLAP